MFIANCSRLNFPFENNSPRGTKLPLSAEGGIVAVELRNTHSELVLSPKLVLEEFLGLS